MGEKYTLGDTVDYFRDRILDEGKRILSLPSLVRNFIEVITEKYPEKVYIAFLIGDFADHGGVGHLEHYKKFKRDLYRVENKEADEITIGGETYHVARTLTGKALISQEQKDQIEEAIYKTFQTRDGKRTPHGDADFTVVAPDGTDEKSLRAGILDDLTAYGNPEMPYDFREVFTVGEFCDTLRKQSDIVGNFADEGKKSKINVKCSGAKIIITTDPPVDLYVIKLETKKEYLNALNLQQRVALLKFKPAYSPSHSLHELFENSRGIIIYQNAPKSVQEQLDEYMEKTGQPKRFETLKKNYKTYIDTLKEEDNFGTRLEKKIQEATKSLEEIEELSKL
jgi:hypothetical protein